MPLESLSHTYLFKWDERTKHSGGVRLLMGALLVKETDKASKLLALYLFPEAERAITHLYQARIEVEEEVGLTKTHSPLLSAEA